MSQATSKIRIRSASSIDRDDVGGSGFEYDDSNAKRDRIRARQFALLGAFILIVFVASAFILSFSPSSLHPHHRTSKLPRIKSTEGLQLFNGDKEGCCDDKPANNQIDANLGPGDPVNILTSTIELIKSGAASAAAAVADSPDQDGCRRAIPRSHFTGQHVVEPPSGDVTIVCCQSTKGTLNIAVHPSWAPIGAARFLDMVNSKFFETQVPLFRALKGFLVQFGLAGDAAVQKAWHEKGNLKDDPSWLPLGPPGRMINGVSRFQRGYWAYAGAGKNSRGTQLIMAFNDNQYLGGGSPWEVPFGQLIGEESFNTSAHIYTGYGEKPSQGKIMNRGKDYTLTEFPKLDYITSCKVVADGLPWRWEGSSPASADQK